MRRLLISTALLTALASPVASQQPASVPVTESSDTMPAAVVQRFVDAANARDAEAMATLVAPQAVFARFPSGQVLVEGRDSIRAFYARRLEPRPPEFHITVALRMVEGSLVVDQEHFGGTTNERQQATWMYQVRDGLIRLGAGRSTALGAVSSGLLQREPTVGPKCDPQQPAIGAIMHEIRILTSGDTPVLDRTAPDVFDEPVHPRWTAEFLADPRHHLAVALSDGVVVGMASAVHYVHPDKPPELWINEVGVAAAHHRQGLARQLLQALFGRGRELGCTQAWVLADQSNTVALRLYTSVGGEAAAEPCVMFEFPLAEAPPAPPPAAPPR